MTIAESFGQSAFARFVNSTPGRLARLIAGIDLIALGYMQRDGATGLVLIVVGLVPLATGAFDQCLISVILGGPISGERLRKRAAQSKV